MAAASRLDTEKAGLILADAFVMGDKAAAKKWGISDRSVRNYWTRVKEDEELAAHYAQAKARFVANWSAEAEAFMNLSMQKLVALVAVANHPDYIGDIAKAAQIVGELLVTERALREPESASEGQAAKEAAGGAARRNVN